MRIALMQVEIAIKAAEKDDVPALLALYRQLNPADPTIELQAAYEILEKYNQSTANAIFVGYKADKLVTTCALVVVPNLTRGGASYALIENVVTDASERKRSYGNLILRAAISRAWQFNCYKVMLLTGSKRPETLAFYRGVGFEQNKAGFQIRRPESTDF